MIKSDERTFQERVADSIAAFAGSWRFIIIFAVTLSTWILFNSLETEYRFDPMPFLILNLILNFIAAFTAPFIMMSQHRAEKRQDLSYREIFLEMRELLKQDIEHEKYARYLEEQIRQDVLEIINNLKKSPP